MLENLVLCRSFLALYGCFKEAADSFAPLFSRLNFKRRYRMPFQSHFAVSVKIALSFLRIALAGTTDTERVAGVKRFKVLERFESSGTEALREVRAVAASGMRQIAL